VDYGLLRKEVDPGTTFEDGGVSLWIPLLIDIASYPFICWLSKCVYVYIIVNTISSWFIKYTDSMVIFWLKKMCLSIFGCYCKYHNELCYKAPVNNMIVRF